MRSVVIDLQGFKTPEFVPKEIAIWDGERIAHYVFKEPFPFRCLSSSLQRQANWLTKNHHKLKWSDGDVDLSRIPHILSDIKNYADVIYCKGEIKCDFLRKYFYGDVLVKDLKQIVNLKSIPRLNKTLSNAKCYYHDSGVCAVDNVKLIYDYIIHPFIPSFHPIKKDNRNKITINVETTSG